MLKRVGILMLAAMFSAIVFGGCGAGAEGTAASGFPKPAWGRPAGTGTIQIEERDKTYTWEYQYTADILLDFAETNIGGSCTAISLTTTKMKTAMNFEWMNRDGLSYRAPLREDSYRWQADSLSEESLFDILEQALDEIAVFL